MTLKVTMVHTSIMMRRAAYEAVGGYRAAFLLSQDIDLWLRVLQRYDVDNLSERLVRWRVNQGGTYVSRRELQLKYGGIALAFAQERERYGTDSYRLLEDAAGDLDRFADTYRLKGLLHAIWGELVFRGVGDAAAARSHFTQALAKGFIRPRTLALFGLSLAGRAWPGGRPMPPAVHQPNQAVG